MATVNKELARELVENDGVYEDDQIPYCVVMYQNKIKYGEKIIYDPDKPGNCWDYAICYERRDYLALVDSPVVGGIEFLWADRKFVEDEVNELGWGDRESLLMELTAEAEYLGEENGYEYNQTWRGKGSDLVRDMFLEVLKSSLQID